jgi:hypothetical protein
MNTEFFSMQMSREDLMELHAAMVQRAMLEDDTRREVGLEQVSRRPLLEKLDALLGLSAKQEEAIADTLDDELWEHAWFTFTDEWAWFRAKQEVERDLGKVLSVGRAELHRRIEERYQKDFDRFVKEVEMGAERKRT